MLFPARRVASYRGLLVVALSSCALLSAVPPGHAAEETSGLDGFFREVFSGSAAAQANAPALSASTALPNSMGQRRLFRAHQHVRARSIKRPHVTYAALPAPEKAKDTKPKGPVEIVALQDRAYLINPAAALLQDETLRKGDIVVLRDGPKVFMGATQAVHRTIDFQDARHSRAISSDLRKRLFAMTTPIGALPADEARKRVSGWQTPRSEPHALSLRVTAKLENSVAPLSPRVIYP